ncbi:MAG: phosphatase PAP2 family protein [Saprospiraceae bacterium]
MKKFILACSILISHLAYSQSTNFNDSILHSNKDKFHYKQIIIPSICLAYGVTSLKVDYLKSLNLELRNELQENHHSKFGIDDFLQYTPVVAVYGLNMLGINGKNRLKERTIKLVTSYVITSSLVLGLKSWTKVLRPDSTSHNSFPSGHTANAFLGAEFLWQEFHDENIWYGIAGYIVASGTGFFRIYNNRHWFSDVVMGAGIGMLSTKISYWMYPYLKNKLFRSHKNMNTSIFPMYNRNTLGLGLIMSF